MRIINKSGQPLTYATPGSIGLDLRAVMGSEHRDIEPGRRWRFGTGISIELPPGHGAFVQPRSGISANHGVYAITGTIDTDYRGEIFVLLHNASPSPYRVMRGDRIAQLVVVRVAVVDILEVDKLGDTERGTLGFGSTGR